MHGTLLPIAGGLVGIRSDIVQWFIRHHHQSMAVVVVEMPQSDSSCFGWQATNPLPSLNKKEMSCSSSVRPQLVAVSRPADSIFGSFRTSSLTVLPLGSAISAIHNRVIPKG